MSQNYPMDYTNESLQRYSDVDVLSTHGRMGRKYYFVYSIIIPALIFWAIASVASLVSYLPLASTPIANAIIGLAIFAVMFAMVRLTIQRCHDFNKSGFLAVLALIPLANIVFALIPGTNGLNQYGEAPKPASTAFTLSVYILLFALIATAIYMANQFLDVSMISNLVTF